MPVINVTQRKIFKRRRDGQESQGGGGSQGYRVASSTSGSDFNPVILQDYAKKVGGNLFKGDQNFEDNVNIAKKLSVFSLAIGGNDFDPNNIARTNIDNQFVGQTINGHLVVKGDITQTGSAYITHAQHVNVESNLMQLNLGETAAQITGVIPGTSTAFSGIEINRGSADPYYLGVVEGANPLIKLGKKNNLVTLAAREDSPLNNGVMVWDDANHRIKALAAAPDSDKLGGQLAANYARTDINETFNGKIWIGGEINPGSQAKLQVKGFMRTGNIYLAEGGNSPTNQSRILSNNAGLLEWHGNTVWTALNSNKVDVDWSAKNLTAVGVSKVYGEFQSSQDVAAESTGYYSVLKSQYYIKTGYLAFVGAGGAGKVIGANGYGASTDLYANNTIVANLTTSLATFNTDTKTTGNGTISGYLGSPSYVSGFSGSGWRVDNTGLAELDNLYVRKTLNVYELLIQKIRSVNGSIVVSPANGKVASTYTWGSSNEHMRIILEEEGGFKVGDRYRCQTFRASKGVKYYISGDIHWMSTDGKTLDIYYYTRGWNGTDFPEVGDEIVQWGSTDSDRQGMLYMTASDSGAPYLDVLDGVNGANMANKTKVRLGKLSGITDPVFGNLEGYGLYAQNAYLTGGINASFGKIANYTIENNFLYIGNKYTGSVDNTGGLELRGDNYKRMIVHNKGNYVMQYHYDDNNWGLQGYDKTSGTTIFELGSTNKIAGCNFDYSHIWASDKWRLNSDGSGSLASGSMAWDTSGNVTFAPTVKMSWGQITGGQDAVNSAKNSLLTAANPNLLTGDTKSEISSSAYGFRTLSFTDNIPNGQKISLQFEGKNDQGLLNAGGYIRMYIFRADWSWGNFNVVQTANWSKREWTTIIGGNESSGLLVSFYMYPNSVARDSGKVYCRNVKIEYGENATPYVDTANFTTTITKDTITSTYINALDISASSITTGTLSATRISTGSLHGNKITAGTITANEINATSIAAATVTAGNVNALTLTIGSGKLGGFNVDGSYLWSGTKQTGNAYSSSGITLASTGAIRAKQFRIDTDGAAYFKGAITGGTITGAQFQTGSTGKRMVLSAADNNMKFYKDTSSLPTVQIDTNLYGLKPGMVIHNGIVYVTSTSNSKYFTLIDEGKITTSNIFATGDIALNGDMTMQGNAKCAKIFTKSLKKYTGNNNLNLDARYQIHDVHLSNNVYVYLPLIANYNDGDIIYMFTSTNYNAIIKARSSAKWANSTTKTTTLSSIGYTLQLVKSGDSWWTIGYSS